MAGSGDSDQNEESVRTEEVLRVVVDYGSGMLKVAAQHVRAGMRVGDAIIEDVPLKAGEFEMEQKLVVFDDGSLLRGDHEVDDFVREEPKRANEVIELWKLCLCPQYQQQDAARAVWAALAANHGNTGAIQKLISTDMKWIRRKILTWFANKQRRRISRAEVSEEALREVDIEFMVTVPCMWDGHAEGIMKSACVDAGFRKVKILHEPVCAAASILTKLVASGVIGYGELVCFVDIGRGTVDIASVQIIQPSAAGHLPRFAVIGKRTGDYAGSQLVNDHVWDYVKRCPEVTDLPTMDALNIPPLENALRLLGGMTLADFYQQVSHQVEYVKTTRGGSRGIIIVVYAREGWSEVHGGLRELAIHVPVPIVEAAYTAWTDELERAVTTHLKPKAQDPCRVAIPLGGGSKNQRAQDRLSRCLQRQGREYYNFVYDRPVTHGGLLQYPDFQPETLPSGFWYLARNEKWMPEGRAHQDVTKWVIREGKGKIRIFTGDDRGETWEEEPDKDVPDRSALFAIRKTGQPMQFRRIPLEFAIDASVQTIMDFHIYHSSAPIGEHRPLRNQHGGLRAGLQEWPYQFVDLPALSDFGFKPVDINGEEMIVVRAIIEMSGEEEHLDIKVSILEVDEDFHFAGDQAELVAGGGNRYKAIMPTNAHRTIPQLGQTTEFWDAWRTHLVAGAIHGDTRKLASGRTPRKRKR